ncbi:MAG TPA: ATP-binding protein [Polyangiaceae bacterium]|nr:ATP-binding protein [Polyangiaceae bacterium]
MNERGHPDGSPRDGVLARRLAGSFARVVGVATLTCAVLLLLLSKTGAFVHQMQGDESAIRRGLDLAMAVREQYIHAAHTIIVGDLSHLEHYQSWVDKIQTGAAALRSQVPDRERWRIDALTRASQESAQLFRNEVVPAVLAGNTELVRRLHERLDDQAATAAEHADLVAAAVEARMSHAHLDTTRVTYAAAAVAVFGIIFLVGLSMYSTRKLRELVLRPLGALAEAATRIGQGDFRFDRAAAGEGELGLVAAAFAHMVEELSEHQRRLVASERMAAIGQLAAGVAHEINNPIGVIRGYLRTMIPEAERDELRRELRILDEEAAACQRIADDLVVYARSREASTARVEMAELLRQTAERFEASGESRGCRIEASVAPCTLPLNPVRIRQVLQNLLRNAVEASPAAGLIEVRGEAAEDGSYLIRVLDRGSGIPAEVRPRIFEPFLSGRANGTGLGLAVCDGIVRAHHGSIEALDRPGGGTEFVVRLPRQEMRAA